MSYECPECNKEETIIALVPAFKIYDIDDKGRLNQRLDTETQDAPNEWRCRNCGVFLTPIEDEDGVEEFEIRKGFPE